MLLTCSPSFPKTTRRCSHSTERKEPLRPNEGYIGDLNTFPPFITNITRVSAFMSSNGLPSTAMMSASFSASYHIVSLDSSDADIASIRELARTDGLSGAAFVPLNITHQISWSRRKPISQPSQNSAKHRIVDFPIGDSVRSKKLV